MAARKSPAPITDAPGSAVGDVIPPALLKPIRLKYMVVELEGESPLIVHAWSKKAKEEMLAKQMKRAPKGRDVRDPDRDYEEAFYRLADGRYGFPAVAFKAAAVDACSQLDKTVTKVFMRGVFHVLGDMVPIIGEPRRREDMVRVGMGTADLRFRPEFPTWAAKVPLRFNADAISEEMLVNIFNLGGFAVGIGEWRPQRDGPYGRFHVKSWNLSETEPEV